MGTSATQEGVGGGGGGGMEGGGKCGVNGGRKEESGVKEKKKVGCVRRTVKALDEFRCHLLARADDVVAFARHASALEPRRAQLDRETLRLLNAHSGRHTIDQLAATTSYH